MIRKMQSADLNCVSQIWLNTNISSHNFIHEDYWKSNYTEVKSLLSKAEIYVYEDRSEIFGFIGLNGNYIEGVFVSEKMQSKGIGTELLNFVKSANSKLSLNVYKKNKTAVNFYRKQNFIIKTQDVDKNTGEYEYLMVWSR